MTPPSTIARYRITSKLGEGGMGAVYCATDTKLNRDVAIKLLPPAFAEDAARMQRFERPRLTQSPQHRRYISTASKPGSLRWNSSKAPTWPFPCPSTPSGEKLRFGHRLDGNRPAQ